MAPIATRVERAFFQAGGRNAGTPLEMASTPVTAAPPEPKALRAMNTEAPRSRPLPWWVPSGIIPSAEVDPAGRLPAIHIRYAPTDSRTPMQATKKYVGAANNLPDSLVPRRLPTAMRITKPMAIQCFPGARAGAAEASASLPAATDTATVRM